MSTDVNPTTELVEAPATELATADTPTLKQRLTSLLARTADDLREMAAIVAELESRGEDLSALRLGIVDHLRRIAAGQLLPEIVVRFSGFPLLLRTAVLLPLEDQRKLACGEPVELAVWRDGQVDWRRVDPFCLTGTQLRLVFAADRLRSRQEQVSLLEQRATSPAPRPRPRRKPVRPDSERGGLVVGRSFAPLDEVLSALAMLRDADYTEDVEGETTLVVKLTAAEHRQLKIRAAQSGVGMNWLVRRALSAHGLIRGDVEDQE